MSEFTQDNTADRSFDADRLKALPRHQLVEALLDEAYTAAQIHEDYRSHIEDKIMTICWLPTAEELTEMHMLRSEATDIISRLFSAVEENELETEEALQNAARRKASHALASIVGNKQDLDAGLRIGLDEDGDVWSDDTTQYLLLRICEAQQVAGIAVETDYVRETAMRGLQETPGHRGVVLLHNALSGDVESYQLGVAALQEAAQTGELGRSDAAASIAIIAQLIHDRNPDQIETLQVLSIDMLGRFRDWRELGPSYAEHYADAAARLAVTLRDLDQTEFSYE